MGYPTKVQLIKRTKGADQWYINFPTAVAQVMAFEQGEVVEWEMEDKRTLVLQRTRELPSLLKKKHRKDSSGNSNSSGSKVATLSGKNAPGKEPKHSR